MNCTNNGEVFSFHPGGTNAMFADGSVRFLRESIDIRVLACLITRAGAEIVPGDF
jgi:prepilin-type processing-associated H-X9-DG protein